MRLLIGLSNIVLERRFPSDVGVTEKLIDDVDKLCGIYRRTHSTCLLFSGPFQGLQGR